ncbi:SH3 domain-containing protein [Streptomyces sp. H28]|uniref:SH3 domain-containing protein n=1 Tax=Streptomyces sp. H28 TaxID=2775865 RepID=UPI0017855EB0|nr:SH3 domain-containing protein [Streptomyces sp. H28]MBD9730904.1 SH3 domain-containing protein [Streptomyces sp. H28]
MSLRSPLTRRLPIALAAGALALATAVTPAVASDDGGPADDTPWSQQNGTGGNGTGNGTHQGGTQQGGNQQGASNTGGNGDWGQQNGTGGNGTHQGGNQQGGNGTGGNGDWGQTSGGSHGDQGEYRGVVTADKLALRSAPTRGSQVIRYAHRGQVVSIFCKVPGDNVNGNPLWYLLTDGTWAWGAARYIDNIGPAPRWC